MPDDNGLLTQNARRGLRRLIGGCLVLIVLAAVVVGVWIGWPYVAPMFTSKPAVPTNAPIAQATTAPAVKPTNAPQNAPTAKPNVVVQPTATGPEFVVAFDAFPTYDPVIGTVSTANGVNVKLVPFDLDNKNSFTEAERAQMLTEGKWDVLFTTYEKVKRYPKMGKIIYVTDETAGSDMGVCVGVNDLNGLKGKRIAYADGSVSEFLVYWSLDLVKYTKTDVKLLPKAKIDDAVDAFLKGEADCVFGWSPNIDKALEKPGAKPVITSENLRLAMDVIVISNDAANKKGAQVLAFLEAFVKSSNQMWDDPDAAAKIINDWDTTDWTGIDDAASLNDQMATIAPATFPQNALIMKDLSRFQSRLDEAGVVLKKFGIDVPESKSLDLIDARFVTELAKKQDTLKSKNKPQNPTFTWLGQVDAPVLTAAQQSQVITLATTELFFPPEGTTLSAASQKALDPVIETLKKFNDTYFEVSAMAAHPRGDYTREGVLDVAKKRARAVADYLIVNGIPESRILFGGHKEPQYLGALDPEHPLQDEKFLTLDRKAVFRIVKTGR